jgi:hypothetical protein
VVARELGGGELAAAGPGGSSVKRFWVQQRAGGAAEMQLQPRAEKSRAEEERKSWRSGGQRIPTTSSIAVLWGGRGRGKPSERASERNGALRRRTSAPECRRVGT